MRLVWLYGRHGLGFKKAGFGNVRGPGMGVRYFVSRYHRVG